MKHEKYLGVVLIILSALFFALMATTVKSVSDFPLIQKVFFRNFVGVVLLSFYMISHKDLLKVNHKPLLLSRCLLGLMGVFLYYRSLELLALSEAVVINKLSPFFVVLLGGLILKEKIKPLQVFAVFIALAGTVVLIRPSTDVNLLPALTGLSGAFAAASAYTIIRHLRKFDKPITIVFYFCLLSSIITLPLLIPVFVMPRWIEGLKLIMIGVFALSAQLLMTQAYHFAPASQLSIYTYLNIIFSTLLGVVLYQEVIEPFFIIGAGLIIFGGFLNFYAHKPKPLKNKQSKNT